MSIILSNNNEENVHMTHRLCLCCGKKFDESIIMGKVTAIYTCNNCDTKHIGRPSKGLCTHCGSVNLLKNGIKHHSASIEIGKGFCDNCTTEKKYMIIHKKSGGMFILNKQGRENLLNIFTEDIRKDAEDRVEIGLEDDVFDKLFQV